MSTADSVSALPSTSLFPSVDRRQLYPDASDPKTRIVVSVAPCGNTSETWVDFTCYGSTGLSKREFETLMGEVKTLCPTPGWVASLRSNELGDDSSTFILRAAGSDDALRWQLTQSEFSTGGFYLGE